MIFRAAKIHFSNELAKFLNQILLFLRIIIYLKQQKGSLSQRTLYANSQT